MRLLEIHDGKIEIYTAESLGCLHKNMESGVAKVRDLQPTLPLLT